MIKEGLVIAGIVAAPAALYFALGEGRQGNESASSAFAVPDFSARAFEGREFFAEACGICHGSYGEGTDRGPPLVHMVYAPDELSDSAFRRAVHDGAVARHWPFGDMPAMAGQSDGKVEAMLGFIREMQKANNIY